MGLGTLENKNRKVPLRAAIINVFMRQKMGKTYFPLV